MKTLISNSAKLNPQRKPGFNMHIFLLSLSFCLLSFVISGSAMIPQNRSNYNNDLRSKRLDILEKLEGGKAISLEEISKSMADLSKENMEVDELFLPGMNPDIQFSPEISPFTGPFYYHYHDGKDHVIISDIDIKEIHKILNDDLEELRRDIESFRNSEDFMIIHDELQKWNENFKKELNKIREELMKSVKETRSKGTTFLII
jgi:hypothetical protein